MLKKLTKTGNSLALVIDKPLLDFMKIDTNTPLEVSSDGEVIVISPVRSKRRSAMLREIAEDVHKRYAGVFKRLANE